MKKLAVWGFEKVVCMPIFAPSLIGQPVSESTYMQRSKLIIFMNDAAFAISKSLCYLVDRNGQSEIKNFPYVYRCFMTLKVT
jgi:hypothetical protein